jgi:glycosyltransferase involved in cell wall biosynthesis
MRVLLVAQTYFPYTGGGGRPVKVRAIAEGLVARGHQVTVLTADLGAFGPGQGDGLEIRHTPLGRRSSQNGVDVLYLRTAMEYRFVTVNPTLPRFCRTELPSYDVVHIFGIYDILGAVVAAYCRGNGIPYVLEPIGMFRPVSRSLLPKRLYHAVVGARLVRGAARVVATSEQERREITEGGVPAARTVVRRNGVALPSELPPRGRFRRRIGIPAEARLVLFLGRLIRKKGPDLLLRAFAIAADGPAPDGRPWHLALVGPEERDGFRSELDRIVREDGLSARVTFAGPVHGDSKWDAYRDADVFVLPSVSENFGNTVAEAMACGTPVIVTERCGIAELVADGDGMAGLVVPYDASALADALRRLATDPALGRELASQSRRLSERLGWDEPVAETESLYLTVRSPREASDSSAVIERPPLHGAFRASEAGAPLATSTAESPRDAT